MSLIELLILVFLGGFVAGAFSGYGLFFSFLGAIIGITFFYFYHIIHVLLKENNTINKTLFVLLFVTVMFLIFYLNHILFYSEKYLDSIIGGKQMILNYIYFFVMVNILWYDFIKRR